MGTSVAVCCDRHAETPRGGQKLLQRNRIDGIFPRRTLSVLPDLHFPVQRFVTDFRRQGRKPRVGCSRFIGLYGIRSANPAPPMTLYSRRRREAPVEARRFAQAGTRHPSAVPSHRSDINHEVRCGEAWMCVQRRELDVVVRGVVEVQVSVVGIVGDHRHAAGA